MRLGGLLIACLSLMPSLSGAFCFDEAGGAFGINPFLLRGIARVESGLNPGAINRNTDGSLDIGLMQVNSSWISRMGFDRERLRSDPCYNVMAGARVLKLCIDRFGYTWEAVGCYNAVSRSKRVDYSWKVFDMLKRLGENTAERGAGRYSRPSTRYSEVLQTAKDNRLSIKKTGPGDKDSPSVIPSLSFSVRDTAAIEQE